MSGDSVSRTYRLPAEWEPQSGVMITWPHSGTDWAPLLATIEDAYVTLATILARYESVLIVCRDLDHLDHVNERLKGMGIPADRLRLAHAPSNDTWTRDHGPITVLRDERPVLMDFTFNGWGNKFPSELDNRINLRLHESGQFGSTELDRVDLVLEGGSIESDGQGTLLTTEQCLVHGNRNAGMDRDGLEQSLRRYLGCDRVLWLHHGALAGDDTDGHVDTLARFCSPRTIAYSSCDDPADEHYEPLKAMERELRALRRTDGQPYSLVPLPLPAPIRHEGERLPATYANFLIVNGAVLVPTYQDPADSLALDRLARCFHNRSIVAVDARALVRHSGSLHCATMQLPRGVLT